MRYSIATLRRFRRQHACVTLDGERRIRDASHFLQEDAGDPMAKSIQVFMRVVSDHGAG